MLYEPETELSISQGMAAVEHAELPVSFKDSFVRYLREKKPFLSIGGMLS